MLPDKNRGFKIQRNPSWRSSAKTGFYYGVWFAPSTLMVAVGRPVIQAIDALGAAVLRGASWVAISLSLVVLGLAGFVTPDDVNQS